MSATTQGIDKAKAPLLVLAVGNPSRGDDAFGPLLAERLEAWLPVNAHALRDQVELITDLQLMVEHVFDLQGRTRVLFIDAAAQGEEGMPAITTVKPLGDTTVQSHACTPAQLLTLYAQLLKATAPRADLLSLTGSSFELGEPLSDRMQAAMPAAWHQLMNWLQAS